jgi:hypothetical protein
MQAVPKSFDDDARAKFQTANRHQRLRVNKALAAAERRRNGWRGRRHGLLIPNSEFRIPKEIRSSKSK